MSGARDRRSKSRYMGIWMDGMSAAGGSIRIRRDADQIIIIIRHLRNLPFFLADYVYQSPLIMLGIQYLIIWHVPWRYSRLRSHRVSHERLSAHQSRQSTVTEAAYSGNYGNMALFSFRVGQSIVRQGYRMPEKRRYLTSRG